MFHTKSQLHPCKLRCFHTGPVCKSHMLSLWHYTWVVVYLPMDGKLKTFTSQNIFNRPQNFTHHMSMVSVVLVAKCCLRDFAWENSGKQLFWVNMFGNGEISTAREHKIEAWSEIKTYVHDEKRTEYINELLSHWAALRVNMLYWSEQHRMSNCSDS